MSMRALVLAGGSGTRLRPFTHTTAKQLMPVANRPVLFYGLQAIADAGIDQAAVVVGDSAAEIEAAVGDGSRFGLEVDYLPQEAPLGLAHAVLIAREHLGDDDFVLYLGDIIVLGGIRPLIEQFRRERPDAQLLLGRVAEPGGFGVAELDPSGAVIRLEEKPERPGSDLAVAGVYVFTPVIHEAVREIGPSHRGELEITDAIQLLIDRGLNVRSTVVSECWKDAGSVDDMLEVNRMMLETLQPRIKGSVDDASEIIGRVVLEAGVEVRRSRIVGPTVIGRDTVVVDSSVGPFTSVEHECRIVESEIEFSIVEHNSSIVGMRRIEASLIGRHVEITPAPSSTDAQRFVAGDHSRFQVGR